MKRLAAAVLALGPALASGQEPAPAATPTPAEAPVEAATLQVDAALPPPPEIPAGFASAAPLGDVTEAKPAITFQHTAPDFSFTALRVDGVAVTELVAKEGDAYVYRPPLPFAGGEHAVEIDFVEGQAPSSARWAFRTTPPPPRPDTAVGWSFSGEVSRSHAEPVGREGPTANQTLPTIAPNVQGTVTDTESKVTAGWNATYTQSYDPNNPPPHVSPPAVVLSAQKSIFKATLGNGPLETFAPSTLVQTISTRRGLELGLDSKLGSLRVYGNFDDGLPSSAGVNEFRQNLYGVSVTPMIDSTGRFKFRLLWQYAEDVKDPLYNGPPQIVPPLGDIRRDRPRPRRASTTAAAIRVDAEEGSADFGLGGIPRGSGGQLPSEGRRGPELFHEQLDEPARDRRLGLGRHSRRRVPSGSRSRQGSATSANDVGAPANPALIAGRLIWDVAISRAFGALSVSATYARTNDGGSRLLDRVVPGADRARRGRRGLGLVQLRLLAGLGLALSDPGKPRPVGRQREQADQPLAQRLAARRRRGRRPSAFSGGARSRAAPSRSQSDLRGATLGVGTQGTFFSLQTGFGLQRDEERRHRGEDDEPERDADPRPELFQPRREPDADRDVDAPDGVRRPVELELVQLRRAPDAPDVGGDPKGFGIYGQYVESQVVPQAEGVPITRDRRMSAGLAMLLGGGSLGPQIAQQIVTPTGRALRGGTYGHNPRPCRTASTGTATS